MRDLAERVYFTLCLALGGLLRSARYAKAEVVARHGVLEVRKRRAVFAPLLVALGDLLVRVLNTGVRVLPQRDWEDRERRLHAILRGASIGVDADGTLVLPCLPGETLAAVLDAAGEEPERQRAIAAAVAALAELHRRGWTHGDAMAENVLIDRAAGVAHWFDFETEHDARRSMLWRRADDVRALLATCLVRTAPARRAETVRLVLDAYADDAMAREVATAFTSVWRRPLAFHLGQAAMSRSCFREIGRLLSGRPGM